MALLFALAAPALAAPYNGAFDASHRWSAVSGPGGIFTGMALARDGSMWVSDDNPPYALLRFAKNGRVNRYPTEFPPFEMTIGADGALYVGSYYLVARVETGKSKRGSYVEYPTPSMGSVTGTLILASDGHVWFTEGGVAQDSIANVAPNGAITEYPTNNAYPFAGLVQGKDGNLWFGASRFNQPGVVMNINPMTGAMQSFALSSSVCGPTYSLARDSSGEMWFLCDNAGIAHLATDGTYTIVATSGADDFPSNLIADRSGKLWYAGEIVKNGRAFRASLWSFETQTSKAVVHPAPREFPPPFWNPVIAADGSIWLSGGPQIARYVPN